ncbi:SH3 domain-containing protein, partial [Leptospira ilyithenensis]|uniref:SH3 domain-containing protein n=1 Tax=Leptospira ilyithenensis TaxID=2484901 RepID=UPI0014385CF0
SKDSIRFKTYGSEQVHKYKVKQISENQFEFENQTNRLYFRFSYDPTYKRDDIFIYDTKENLLKEKSSIAVGNAEKAKDGLCIDRKQLETSYRNRKSEIEAGPASNGGYFKLEVGYNTITKDDVIVREKPSKDSKGIRKLKLGTTVALLEDTNIVDYIQPYG